MQLWDLGKGFCVRSVPCVKMPNTLMMSRDSNTIVTGIYFALVPEVRMGQLYKT